ncbi:MAG TPA: hypothetical protein VNC50_19410 [Planctomycetia bacterium]|nr:hypothetical protein [Planctomycetia bacterium]
MKAMTWIGMMAAATAASAQAPVRSAIQVPAQPGAPAIAPQPVPVAPLPGTQVVSGPPVAILPGVPVVAALPVSEAPKVFVKPAAGKYVVTFVHPVTKCPVPVEFCLKCGCYKASTCSFLGVTRLHFKAPGFDNDVTIKFKRDGSVAVDA